MDASSMVAPFRGALVSYFTAFDVRPSSRNFFSIQPKPLRIEEEIFSSTTRFFSKKLSTSDPVKRGDVTSDHDLFKGKKRLYIYI